MQLNTPVNLPHFPFEINHQQQLCFIGSCFAENMSQQFADHKFATLSNPFGVLYNPISVGHCINDLVDVHFDESRMIKRDELWHSFGHHGSFSKPQKEELITSIDKSLKIGHQWLKNSDIVFFTFGTASVFEYNNQVVSNCHKIPEKLFSHRRLSVNEIVETFGESLKKLRALNPKVKIVFTVSPVRYTKDGLHDNSLNKATLHLAIDALIQAHSDCFYFPAYEMVIDELRDYRFFKEDMTHPNNVAVNYIWEKLSNHYFSAATIALNKQVLKLTKACAHRPMNSHPEAHEQFLKSMLKKASDLQKQHPELDLRKEIAYFSRK